MLGYINNLYLEYRSPDAVMRVVYPVFVNVFSQADIEASNLSKTEVNVHEHPPYFLNLLVVCMHV